MASRMLEYYLLLWRRYSVQPVQQMIYVGGRPMSMSAEIQHENLTFRYRIIDMRELDSEALLQSPVIEDTLLAILCRLDDTRAAVRRILARVAQSTQAATRQCDVAASGTIGIKKFGSCRKRGDRTHASHH